MVNKILRLEQEGERLHAVMNDLESKNKNIMDKGKRYYNMIRDHENKMYTWVLVPRLIIVPYSPVNRNF